jgi:hypothetical protein
MLKNIYFIFYFNNIFLYCSIIALDGNYGKNGYGQLNNYGPNTLG